MKFKAEQFTATKWNTGADKAKWADQFVRFVEGGFQERQFTDAFYQRISNTFGHIAHYNRQNFYGHFFTSLEGQTGRGWQGYRRIDVDRPSFAIGTRNNADWICPVGREAYRPRLEQLAVLQGFPEGFRFTGNMTNAHKQMGNACPSALARPVGVAVRFALTAIEEVETA